MQKFTRPLTREIEVAGERLAWTFSEQGIAVRPVGARKPPREITWGSLLCYLTGPGAGQAHPSAEQMAEALGALKGTAPAKKSPPAAETTSPAPAAESRTAGPGQTPAAHDLSTLLARLDQWLKQHRHRYHQALLPGASPADIEALQNALGMGVPEELRTWLSWHNGQSSDFVGHLEQDWDLMSTGRIRDARGELEAEKAAGGWQPAWIPFLADDQDNYLVLDTSQPGHPVRALWAGSTERPVAAASLSAWVEDFLTAAQRGQYHEDPERGSFLRSGE